MGLETSPRSAPHESVQKDAPISEQARRRHALALLALMGVQLAEAQGVAAQQFEAPTIAVETPSMTEVIRDPTLPYSIELRDGSSVTIPDLSGLVEGNVSYLPSDTAPESIVVLVHQTHVMSKDQIDDMALTKEHTPRELARAIESQERQYEILKILAHEKTIDTVCTEGVDSEVAARDATDHTRDMLPLTVAEYVAPYLSNPDLHAALDERDAIMDRAPKEDAVLKERLRSINAVFEQYVPTYKYIVGGDVLLAAEGIITLCPAESPETFAMATSQHVRDVYQEALINPYGIAAYEYQQIVYEHREDAALLNATSQRKPAVAVTFGSQHDFRDALQRLNAAHPDHPYGLIILEPRASNRFATLPASPSETLRAE